VDHKGVVLARMVVAAAIVASVTFGLRQGLFVAAASDAYGYVSQADLWAKGSPIVRQPFARDMVWPNAAETLAPLGYRPYRPAPHGTDIVPLYAPGLPMVMAIFKLLGGPRAVFLVVPLLGGLAIWATYFMGRRLAGPLVGASAAILLASSPPFLFEIVSPTSDVPATAWWALALGLLMIEGRAPAFGAGVATGLSILTRPNIVVLAAVPGALLVWQALRAGLRHDAKDAMPGNAPQVGATARAVLFAAGSIPACIAVALINRRLYGSPLASGYAPFTVLFNWSHVWPNLARYPRWLLETATPFVLLAPIAPFVLPPVPAARLDQTSPRTMAVVWLGFIATVFLSYLFYLPFDDWWYLRFLLPAYPPILVLSSVALVRLLTPFTRIAPDAKGFAAAAVVALVARHGVDYAVDRGAPDLWKAEQRYLAVGEYVASALPERAALVSMQHSGAARYYSGRITVRYDLMRPTDLDLVVEELRRLGYYPYLVLDDWEEAKFRDRFQGHSALAGLDWTPVAQLHSNQVRIYDPADRQPGRPDRPRTPDVVP
jgi:Dolichyl-phosphate-mannose-protein mannosyltransferase